MNVFFTLHWTSGTKLPMKPNGDAQSIIFTQDNTHQNPSSKHSWKYVDRKNLINANLENTTTPCHIHTKENYTTATIITSFSREDETFKFLFLFTFYTVEIGMQNQQFGSHHSAEFELINKYILYRCMEKN